MNGLLRAGLSAAGLRARELVSLKKRDWRKRAIGRVIRKRTVMPVGWIAEALSLGHPNGASTPIRHEPTAEGGSELKQAVKLMKPLER